MQMLFLQTHFWHDEQTSYGVQIDFNVDFSVSYSLLSFFSKLSRCLFSRLKHMDSVQAWFLFQHTYLYEERFHSPGISAGDKSSNS